MLCQIVFLVFGCDWDLCNDEAEYWAWSRHLDWSYYSRGPLDRLADPSGHRIAGWNQRQADGLADASGPAAGCSPGWTDGLGRISPGVRDDGATASRDDVGLVAAGDTGPGDRWRRDHERYALGLLLDLGGRLDVPGLRSDKPRAWIVAGLIGALGVWAKYSFLAFPASVGLFLLTSRTNRQQLLRPGFWTMTLLCLVIGLAPILIWNFRHGWAGAGQLADRVGLSSRATWASIWPVLTFLGGDVAALGGVWWIAGMAAVIAAIAQVIRQAKSETIADTDKLVVVSDSGLIYLLCLWGVIWMACLAASLLGETEANWMVPGYISLVILIGMRVDRVFVNGGIRKWIYAASWCLCLAVVVAIHHMEWFYPTIASYLPEPTARLPVPLRVYEPTARMRGHQALARAVERTVQALRG